MYGSSDTGSGIREAEKKREQDVLSAQKGIDLQFQGFDQNFYKAREKAYLGFALPELADQYQKAQKDLSYSLAAKGLLRSGAAGTLSTSLQREMHKKQQQVADVGIEKRKELEGEVQAEQGRLLSQAMQALDPGATVVAARKSASQFSEPSGFAPVGQMFSDWTNAYVAKKTADAYSDTGQDPLSFSVGKGATTTVR